MSPSSSCFAPKRVLACGLLIATLLVFLVWKRSAPPSHPVQNPAVGSSAAASSSQPRETTGMFGKVERRPLPVSLRTAKHEWTKEDAKVPEVIQQLAHNPDEFFRMVDENDRIKRRQLVYRNETVPMLIERLGDSHLLRSFTLPGLDGKEIEIEVQEIHEEPSLGGGSVIGRVKGRFNSMVSVGYVNGCESFNVISPEDGLYLTADAREPGEVILKEIDLDKYAPSGGKEPDFILTQQPVPHGHTH